MDRSRHSGRTAHVRADGRGLELRRVGAQRPGGGFPVSRLAREEAGFTLIELLLACVLMLVILGATLTTLNSFQSNAETNARQNDSQEEARRATDRLARELRNLASPTNEEPEAIKRALPQDLIVQSVADVRPAGSLNARNTQYVRYCYDAATSRVYRQR